MKREEKLIKNTGILALGTFLPKLASFIILPILTGQLTQEEYGVYDLITVLVSLFLPAVTLQIQTAAFRFLIDVRGSQKEESRIITNIFAYTIPISIIALVILFIILVDVSIVERILICAYFISDILANTERQIIRGLSKNKYYSISAILGSFGQLAFVFIFVFVLKKGLVGATLSLALCTFCEASYLLVKGKIYNYIDVQQVESAYIKELLKYSWPMVPNSMSMWVMRVSDRIVVSIFMGVSANAVYAVANKIPAILTIAQNTFNMAWQENASIVSRDRDAEEYYCKMFGLLFDFMAGMFGLLVAATPVLFRILVRGDYSEAYVQIPILFLAMFFFSLAGYIGGIYVAYKKTASVGITTAVASVCNLVIDVLLINKIGLYAASGSTLISYIFLCLYRMADVRKFVNIRYNWKHIIIVLVVLSGMSVLSMIQIAVLDWINVFTAIILYLVLDGKMTITLIKKLCVRCRKL